MENPRTFNAQVRSVESDILTRFPSLTRLIRVVALCRRPLLKLPRRKEGAELLPYFLSSMEFPEVREVVIRLSEASSFAAEIELLKVGKGLPKGSLLSSLNPFLG